MFSSNSATLFSLTKIPFFVSKTSFSSSSILFSFAFFSSCISFIFFSVSSCFSFIFSSELIPERSSVFRFFSFSRNSFFSFSAFIPALIAESSLNFVSISFFSFFNSINLFSSFSGSLFSMSFPFIFFSVSDIFVSSLISFSFISLNSFSFFSSISNSVACCFNSFFSFSIFSCVSFSCFSFSSFFGLILLMLYHQMNQNVF